MSSQFSFFDDPENKAPVDQAQQVLREFNSEQCACGQPKRKQQSFCSRCYFALPAQLRDSLWRRFGEGYETAYLSAKSWLATPREATIKPKAPDICRNKHGGNPRSEEANESIQASKGPTAQKVWDWIAERGNHGATSDEVAANWICTHNHVAPRISELKNEGRLVPNGIQRKTRAGRNADVLVVVLELGVTA